MELKNAFLLVVIGFCFLIGYSYAEANTSDCPKHFYTDDQGKRQCDQIDGIVLDHYLNQSLTNYQPGHNICFIDFTGPYFDKTNPKMVCKIQANLTPNDGKALYANSAFAQLRKEKDLEYFFLTQAALLGEPQANFNLGMVNYNGMFNQPQNKELAFQYMLTSAIEGYPKAMHNVAEMKLTGDGTEKDLMTSFHWYKKAAAYDLLDSMFMVGKMYEMGWGIQKSNQQAFNWYLKAALKNDGEAMLRMATLISHDKNLGYDTKDAVLLVYLAHQAKNNQAWVTLSEFIKQDIVNDADIKQIGEWVNQTCSENNLGNCVAEIQTNQMVRY